MDKTTKKLQVKTHTQSIKMMNGPCGRFLSFFLFFLLFFLFFLLRPFLSIYPFLFLSLLFALALFHVPLWSQTISIP